MRLKSVRATFCRLKVAEAVVTLSTNRFRCLTSLVSHTQFVVAVVATTVTTAVADLAIVTSAHVFAAIPTVVAVDEVRIVLVVPRVANADTVVAAAVVVAKVDVALPSNVMRYVSADVELNVIAAAELVVGADVVVAAFD